MTLRICLLLALAGAPTTPGDVLVPYEVSKPGFLSLALYDSDGRLVRSLLHGAPRNPGRYAEAWDGRDRYGRALPAGDYTWKSLLTEGLRTEFVTRMGANPVPAWEKPIGNHNNMRSIATDGTHLYLTAAEWEGFYCVAKSDFEGRYVWTNGPDHRSEKHGMSTALLDGRLFELTGQGTVYGYHAATGRCFTDGDRSPRPWNLRWEGDEAKPDSREQYASLIDLDADPASKLLVASYRHRDGLRWFDPAKGAAVDQATGIPAPVGLAAGPDGRIFVISNGAVVSLTRQDKTPRIVIPADRLEHPVRLAVDRSGEILVAENSSFERGSRAPHHQVKRFSPDGRLLRAHGRPGGRADGDYVPADFRGLTDVASDGAGGFFVAEFLTAPRRIARFDSEGRLLREWIGGQPWGWDAFAEPGSPDVMWYACNPFALVRCRVDLARGTWSILETYTDGLQNHEVWQNGNHLRAFGANGRVFIANGPGDPLGLLLYDPAAKRVKPTNAGGLAYRGDQKRWFLREDLRPQGRTPTAYLWNDLDGDGRASAAELAWTDRRPGGTLNPADFLLRSTPEATQYRPGVAWSAPGRTPQGAPVYAPETSASPRWKETDGIEIHPWDFWPAGDGGLYGCFADSWPGWESHGAWYFNSCSGIDRLVKWDKAGRQVWSVGRHSPDNDHENGSTAMARLLIGTARDCVFWGDGSDEEACQGTVWTDDGLYVSEVPRFKGDAVPEWVSRLWVGAEYSFGSLWTDPKGDVYLTLTSTAGGYPVFRVTGWDGWQRSQGRIRLDSPASSAERRGTGLRAEYFASADLSGRPALTRTDPEVYFHWLEGHDPRPLPASKEFSARWTGRVEATTSEEYRFVFSTGTPWRGEAAPRFLRLWVDGRLLIDPQAGLVEPTPYGLAGRIVLEGGRRYDLKVEAGWSGKAVAKLCWDTPSRDRRRITKDLLYPDEAAGPSLPAEGLVEHRSFDDSGVPGRVLGGHAGPFVSARPLPPSGTAAFWSKTPEGWRHEAWTWGPSRRRYVDGLLRDAQVPVEAGRPLRLDAPAVDEVRLYGRPLSPREVEDVYRRETGLLAHFPCDEGRGVIARSVVGSGLEAGFSGSLSWVPGRKGTAVRIDGRRDRGSIIASQLAVDHEIRVPRTDYTIAFWFRTESPEAELACADRDTPYNNNWVDNAIGLRSGKLRAALRGQGDRPGEELFSTATFNDGAWHHVATTLGGAPGEFRLYVDGVEAARGTLKTRFTESNRLGLDFGGGRESWVEVDDLRLYGRALTAPEVRDLAAP
jgi:hypothetical protein